MGLPSSVKKGGYPAYETKKICRNEKGGRGNQIKRDEEWKERESKKGRSTRSFLRDTKKRNVLELKVATHQHFVNQHTQSVPIDTLVVGLGLNDFRSEVVWCSTEGPSYVGNVFSESEIGDLDVSVGSEEDVLRLEISVDDVEGVKVVESEGDFGGVELGDRVWESLGGRGEGRGREEIRLGSVTRSSELVAEGSSLRKKEAKRTAMKRRVQLDSPDSSSTN